MNKRWIPRVFGTAAFMIALLAILCLLAWIVDESDLPEGLWFLYDVLDIENMVEFFYLAAPLLLLVIWFGLYLFHRKQNQVMTLVALVIGSASVLLCVLGVSFGRNIVKGIPTLFVEIESIYAIGIKLPFFVFLIFGILGYRAEGMPKVLGYLTVLLALAAAISNIAQEFRHYTFFEIAFFILLAAWGLWLGILLWRGKLDLGLQPFRDDLRKPLQLIAMTIAGVGLLAVIGVIGVKLVNYAQLPAIKPTPTRIQPTQKPTIDLSPLKVTVLGAGDINKEVVQIVNATGGRVALGGMWDNQGNKYNFVQSDFKTTYLEKGASVQVFTREGANTATELYWGLKEAVWKSGKTVSIYDTQGLQLAYYKIP